MPEWTVPDGELSIAFLDDTSLAEIHGRFLDDPTPTDVITFPGDTAMEFAGEICVSWQRAHAEAQSRGIPLRRELTLYLVHGWLHLAGLDDQTDDQRSRMREAEDRVMTRVLSANLLPDFTLE